MHKVTQAFDCAQDGYTFILTDEGWFRRKTDEPDDSNVPWRPVKYKTVEYMNNKLKAARDDLKGVDVVLNIWRENGYDSRRDYFESLAEEHDVSYDFVLSLANTLGPNEDFDALVTAVEDFS